MAPHNRQPPPPPHPHLVLYDGGCGLCHGLVQFVLARDAAGQFHFATLQGPTARRILTPFAINPQALDSVYVLPSYNGTHAPPPLHKARAALFIVTTLGWPWRLLAAAGVLPTPVLDACYDIVAARRLRIFGRRVSCVVPTPAQRERFIDAAGDAAAMKGQACGS